MAEVEIKGVPSTLAEYHIAPKLIPDASEVVFVSDVMVTMIHLSNKSAAAVTVQILDRQSTALDVVPTVTLDAYSDDLRVFPGGRYCPGGVTWVASAADAVVGYIRGRK